MGEVAFSDIVAAATRIAPHVHRTPVWTCTSLSQHVGAQVWFKCEQFQRTGSFKFRGACNAVFSLSVDALARGVVTHSSGNHAQALARAAQLRGAPVYVVLPSDAVPSKERATRAFGAQVIHCAPNLEARERAASRIQAQTGAHSVHPYDDSRVIAGQGTVGLELYEQLPEASIVIAPVGGGGLLSGLCVALHHYRPGIRIFAAEPLGADDAARSLHANRRETVPQPQTVADGLRAQLSERTFAILRAHVEDVVVVPDEAIVRAMRILWERTKWVVEPSAAIAWAALEQDPLARACRGQTVAVVLTGGNVDLDRLPWRGRSRLARA